MADFNEAVFGRVDGSIVTGGQSMTGSSAIGVCTSGGSIIDELGTGNGVGCSVVRGADADRGQGRLRVDGGFVSLNFVFDE